MPVRSVLDAFAHLHGLRLGSDMKQWLKLSSLVLLSFLVVACSTLEDETPGTESDVTAGVAVDCTGANASAEGCPAKPEAAVLTQDSDRDGIADDLDRCADTPPGQMVGADGCSKCNEILAIVTNLNFEFDSAVLTEEAATKLEPITATLLNNPAINVSVEGHTDSVGAAAYNEALSQTRSTAVANFLAQRGVASERMRPLGLGESMPLVSNASAAGRAINRRVEFRVACAE